MLPYHGFGTRCCHSDFIPDVLLLETFTLAICLEIADKFSGVTNSGFEMVVGMLHGREEVLMVWDVKAIKARLENLRMFEKNVFDHSKC